MPKYRSNLWEGGVQETTPSGSSRVQSQKTYTCCHCNRVVIVPFNCRPDEMGSFCMRCHKPTCNQPKCNAVNGCTPFERRLEEMEARGRLLRALAG